MKTICRLISVVLISMFVFSFISCSNDDSYEEDIQKSGESINLKIIRSTLKSQDDDSDNSEIIELKGIVTDQNKKPIHAHIELFFNPEMVLSESCQTDNLGCFIFKVNAKKEYRLLITREGSILRDEIIMIK